MSLTKTTTVDQITVTETGTVLYREATRIMEDGNQISQCDILCFCLNLFVSHYSFSDKSIPRSSEM